MSSKTIDRRIFFCLGMVGALAGCAAEGPSDNPILRSAQWRAYVAASDLRRNCGPGSAETIRVVYNGNYKEEIRSYDIKQDASGAEMDARRRGSTNLLEMNLLDPFGLWRGERRRVALDANTYQHIKSALIASGFRERPEDARLRSDSFYWVASACFAGEFQTNIWAWPSERYERIRFIEPLIRRDGFDRPLSAPRPPAEMFADQRREAPPFELRFRNGAIY